MPFESFASKLDTCTPEIPEHARFERWLVHPGVPLDATFDRIIAVMRAGGYCYDFAERTDLYFSKGETRVHIRVTTLYDDSVEDLRSTFPDRPIPGQKAVVIECFEHPLSGA